MVALGSDAMDLNTFLFKLLVVLDDMVTKLSANEALKSTRRFWCFESSLSKVLVG